MYRMKKAITPGVNLSVNHNLALIYVLEFVLFLFVCLFVCGSERLVVNDSVNTLLPQ